jgi:YjjG family noncanonical pyrimidine nucleotidase
MATTRFDWLFLDLDNTLLDFNIAAANAFRATLDWLGIPYSDELFNRYLHINRQCWDQVEAGAMDAATLKRERFARFLHTLDRTDDDPLAVNYQYLDFLSREVHPMPHAAGFMETLSKRPEKLALVTNGLKQVQYPRVEASGWQSHFSEIVISDEIGYFKPDPAFFQYVLNRIEPAVRDRILVIGDNPFSDILGGQRSGLQTCWYNPGEHENPLDQPPDFEIQNLNQILSFL